jgi:putative hydrolase of the HAD superfamily
MPIRAFLFDVGNVLLKFDFTKALRAVAAQSAVADEREVLARIDRIKIAWEDGQIERAVFLREVFAVLQYRGTEADFLAAWEDIFELNEPMAALVAELAPRFPLYLLSNTNDVHHAYFVRRYPVFAHFRGGTFSYAVRASKPGREIFQIACRAHALEPGTTFFIDDLRPNIETALALGFQTHHYHSAEHEALLAALSGGQ